jgi:hypothetical protein
VLIFEDLVDEIRDVEDAFNFMNAFIAARSQLFISVFGGHADFCLHFPGTHIIYKSSEEEIGFTLNGHYEALNPDVFYQNLFTGISARLSIENVSVILAICVLPDLQGGRMDSFLNVTSSTSGLLAAVDDYLTRQNMNSKVETYSHLQCSHIPHDPSIPPATHFSGLVPLELYAPADSQRVCMLSNICLNDLGQIEFYLHPIARMLPPMYSIDKLQQGLVRLEGIGGSGWSPLVRLRSLPSSYVFNRDAEVHLFSSFVANNNFGHNLIDNVFTHYFAMQHFNVGAFHTSRIVSDHPCISVQLHCCMHIDAPHSCSVFFCCVCV